MEIPRQSKRKSSSTVDLREMDKLHTEMVRQLEETDEVEERPTVKPARKTSVSTACQTEKVSRKVSHVARLAESSVPRVEELTPVSRATHRTTTERRVVEVEAGGLEKLRECNDVLLSFIEKARVLAQATDITASIPSVLTDKVQVSFNLAQVEELFEEEINKLKMKIHETELSHREKIVELKLLEEENIGLGLSHERNLADLQEKEMELGELDMREAELEFRIGISNAMVVERIKYLEGEIAECQAQIRDSQVAFERMEEVGVTENCAAPDVQTIVELPLSQGSRRDDALELIIKIKNEYLQRMKEVLDKVRLEYRDDYEKFITKMERETDELLSCISSLMSARMEKTAAADHYSGLLELERTRNYQGRISGLQADLDSILARIKARDGDLDRVSAHYRTELIMVDEDLEKLKQKLKSLLQQFALFAKSSLQGTNEVEIYSKLLDFEYERLSSDRLEYKASVRETMSSTRGLVGSPHDSESDHESKPESAKPRRESGYKSEGDKSQDDTLELPRDSFLGDLERQVY